MAEIIFDGNTYHTYGGLPAVGSRAPDMSLVNTRLQTVTLANFMGRRKIMFIFPSIDSPTCAKSCRSRRGATFSTACSTDAVRLSPLWSGSAAMPTAAPRTTAARTRSSACCPSSARSPR